MIGDSCRASRHLFQIGHDEDGNAPQFFQIPPLTASHVADMATPLGLARFFDGFLKPNLDDEGVGTSVRKVHSKPPLQVPATSDAIRDRDSGTFF
jgi:hypothetical protein